MPLPATLVLQTPHQPVRVRLERVRRDALVVDVEPRGPGRRLGWKVQPPKKRRGHMGHATTTTTTVNRLAALHSREQLLVHPPIWTNRQPTLFGCRIHFRGEGGVVEDRDARKRASDELVALLDTI